jgi:hypothetical protein
MKLACNRSVETLFDEAKFEEIRVAATKTPMDTR